MPKGNRAESPSENESVSISARKIANGYVVCTSASGPGGYNYKEEYSETKPNIGVDGRSRVDALPQTSSLKRAVESLNRRK